MSDEVGYSPEGTPPEPQERGQEPSEPTTSQPTKRLGGITGKGFMPGHSGNPTGKHGMNLATMVRRQTQDGAKLVRLMDRIIDGEPFTKQTIVNKDGKEFTVQTHPSIPDMIAAAEWLANRGWGKPKDVGEGGDRRPFLVVLQGDRIVDPLDEPEPEAQAQERRPALPPPMPEIGFDLNLNDIERP